MQIFIVIVNKNFFKEGGFHLKEFCLTENEYLFSEVTLA